MKYQIVMSVKNIEMSRLFDIDMISSLLTEYELSCTRKLETKRIYSNLLSLNNSI
jgi:hypothetical protein